jgi:anti-sigma B factor antagonist
MNIEQNRVEKSKVVLTLNGRLDTANAPLLERKLKQWGDDITDIVLDFKGLDYISSIGLRVLLQAKKTTKAEGRSLTIINMCDSVREVFEMTGFLNLMVQEEKFVVIRKDEPEGIALSFNGEMKTENVPAVSKALSEIKFQHTSQPATVILDMGSLSCISSNAVKSLCQAITDTAWNERKLVMRNASPEVQLAFDNEGLDRS